MQSQIDKVEFVGHLILTEEQVRVLNHAAGFSWDGFAPDSRADVTYRKVKSELHEATGKLVKRFDDIRTAELGKKL